VEAQLADLPLGGFAMVEPESRRHTPEKLLAPLFLAGEL
jgi:hypothetical protein